MESKYRLIAQSFGSDRTKLDEPLSEHMALGLGGPARVFFVAIHPNDIIKMVKMARELNAPVLIFGTGSKMAISDLGFDGVVVKNRTLKITVVGVKGKVSKTGVGVDEALVEVESGVTIQKLVEFLKKQGLEYEMIENLPGTVGGNLILSKQLLEKVQKIKVLDSDGDLDEIKGSDLRQNKHIILSAVFKFKTKNM